MRKLTLAIAVFLLLPSGGPPLAVGHHAYLRSVGSDVRRPFLPES